MSYLQSWNLSPLTLADIESERLAIRRNNHRVLKLKIENGQHLLRLKALINHGDWLLWLTEEADLGYSHPRTAEREMALAERLGDHLADLDESLTNVTALYELTRKHAPADALDTALHLMEQGQTVTPLQAKQLTVVHEASDALGQAVRDGYMTLGDAHAVVTKLTEVEAPAAVIQVVERYKVRNTSVVDALMVLHQQMPDKFTEVSASGTIWNPVSEIEVPLGEASRGDVLNALDTENAERIARQQAYIRQYAASRPGRVGSVVGRRSEIAADIMALIPDNDHQYKAIVYLIPEVFSTEAL